MLTVIMAGCLQVTLRLEVLSTKTAASTPASSDATVPATATATKATAAVPAAASLPASSTQLPTAAAYVNFDTLAINSDQHIVPAAAAASLPVQMKTLETRAGADAEEAGARHQDEDVNEADQQRWLGIRRTLRGNSIKTFIKRIAASSWTPVNQVCATVHGCVVSAPCVW
jgi:hypothetical protein